MGLISTIVYKPNCVQLKQPDLDCWDFLDESAPLSTNKLLCSAFHVQLAVQSSIGRAISYGHYALLARVKNLSLAAHTVTF